MKHHFKILFLMDPYSTLNLATETSLLLMEELIRLEHEVFWVEMDQVVLRQNRVFGSVQPVYNIDPFSLGNEQEESLDNFDALLIRKDPPFDANYLHLTLILDWLDPQVVQLNSPKALRSANEKLFALNWPNLVPKTITTMNSSMLMNFVQQHKKVVVKPLDNCSGRGIELLKAQQNDLESRIQTLLQDQDGLPRYMTAQVYLDEVSQGDKRIYLVHGIPVGMVNRIPAEGNFLGNIHQGARCEKTRLTANEQNIVKTIAPMLRKMGLFFVGLDLIGGKITEINVTSASAVRQINEVTGKRVEKQIVTSMLNYILSLKRESMVLKTESENDISPMFV